MTVEVTAISVETPAVVEVTVAPQPTFTVEVATAGERGPAGPTGPPGTVGVSVQALVNLNALTVVKVMASNVARPASSTNANDGEAVTGITTTGALAGELVNIRTSGALMVPSGNLTVGNVYLSPDGSLTSSPNTGLFMLRVGYAATPSLLVVRIDPPFYRA